jgi:glycerol uptake facilitator-like aquaporin
MDKDSASMIAECFGTFALATAVLSGCNPAIALGILVLLIGAVSGSHVNPAVSAGLASVRRFNISKLAMFWLAQFVGALLALITHSWLTMNKLAVDITWTDFTWKKLFVEILGTAVFLFGINLAVSKKLEGIQLAAAVGGSLFFGAMFGAGLNPAVNLVSGGASLMGMIGPVIGAVLGSWLSVKTFASVKK